jgi:hypothetical protein
MTAPGTLARTAGILYLLLVGAAFNEGYVLPHIVAPLDATATADHIRASATLFRFGVVGDLVAGACWVLLAVALYALLRRVSPVVAVAMLTFAAVGGGIQCLNQLNQYTALTVATDEGYHHAFGKAGADALTQLFVSMQQNGYILDTVFFGLWLAPLGYLVIRSGYFPRVFGVLQITACSGYLADFFARFLTPNLGPAVTAFVMVPTAAAAELGFLLWLLVKGARVPTPNRRVPAVTTSDPAS